MKKLLPEFSLAHTVYEMSVEDIVKLINETDKEVYLVGLVDGKYEKTKLDKEKITAEIKTNDEDIQFVDIAYDGNDVSETELFLVSSEAQLTELDNFVNGLNTEGE